MALCPHCQNVLPDSETRECPNCGGDVGLAAVPSPPAPPSPPAAPAPPTPPVPPVSAGGGEPPAPPSAPPPIPPSAPPGAPPAGAGGPPARPLAGGGGVPPGGARPRRNEVPWEVDRDRLGAVNALIETIKRVLSAPVNFFERMSPTAGIGPALLFAVIVGWLGVVAAGLYQALFNSIVGTGMSGFEDTPEVAAFLGFANSWGGYFVQVLMAPIGLIIGAFLAAGIFHVMLLILGGAREDFEATFRTVAYAQAPAVIMIVPFCGSLIAGIWSMVLYIIGLSTVHRISGGKAAAAVLLPLVILCCCCGVGLGLLFSSIAALATQAQ